eukprot:gnl/TRDRNA2_/TRDRNA2_177789_c2_seq10.p1 gnl/TRDRNA2_/TRDRNA2_177789_c2~~gnl/TRDRNA2_/TRDRNA2_177789_c2_seq10.p1  ORF type:complete len:106 (+),score=11.48 gnl/TRDRNA2_/TRDRNA2_177789_c2_seq10:228-545(+)
MQCDVGAALHELGALVEEEFVTDEGYSIDALVVWHGEQFAVEVDGPNHFLSGRGRRNLNGATLLKHRQLRSMGWRLIVLPYFEWDELRSSAERRECLLDRLQSCP